MSPNPLLSKLGYGPTDRLVIIHTDDIGMCQASITAFEHLWARGTISSGAVMVPCPWFPRVAAMCRRDPGIDMGVHATFNAEWEDYRWGPLSTREPGSGLLDGDGYFPRQSEAVYALASPEALAAELNLQVERALAAGIDVTHIDSHMGTCMHPKFVQDYLQAAARRSIPAMLPRASARGFGMMGIDENTLALYTPILLQIEAMGLPMLDGLFAMPLDEPGVESNIARARSLLTDLPEGISHLILHPAVDTPELRAIAPDWQGRVANYLAFMSAEIKDTLTGSGIHLVGYRALKIALQT